MRSFFFVVLGACFFFLAAPASWAQGAVYGMTNAVDGNRIVVWSRADDGKLKYLQTVETGWGGSGAQVDPTDSLGSQGSLILDNTHHRLFVVNTNSTDANTQDCNFGTITSFVVAPNGKLRLAATVSSNGLFPNSLAIHGNVLYVLNAGGPSNCGVNPNVTGYRVNPEGQMSKIPGSTREIDPLGSNPGTPLDCDNPTGLPPCGLNPPVFVRGPAEVGFSPDGSSLLVTVKGTNSIYVFPVGANGKIQAPHIWKAPGPTQPTYFGFSFAQDHLLVAEVFGTSSTIPAGGASSVSSFSVGSSGLAPINISVPNGQTASCWVAVDPLTSHFAYIANNASSTISAYQVDDDGTLALLNGTAGSADHPNDLAVAQDQGNSFLYVLNSAAGTVGAFRINADGSLTHIWDYPGLPADAGAQGLAAF